MTAPQIAKKLEKKLNTTHYYLNLLIKLNLISSSEGIHYRKIYSLLDSKSKPIQEQLSKETLEAEENNDIHCKNCCYNMICKYNQEDIAMICKLYNNTGGVSKSE